MTKERCLSVTNPALKKALSQSVCCLASKYLCTATRDFKLLCLLLLTTTLRAGKINVYVPLSPSLIWKPVTNIETLKSQNASFPINYQWLHLAGWAAESSNVRPGYFRAPSSQPWAQTVGNLLSMCCAQSCLEAAIAQQLFLPSIPALVQYIWLWHDTWIPLTKQVSQRKQGDGRSVSWTGLYH